jgi:hypothetical protein
MHAPAPKNARACTAPTQVSPAVGRWPRTPSNLLPRANLDAQGGLDCLSVTASTLASFLGGRRPGDVRPSEGGAEFFSGRERQNAVGADTPEHETSLE